MEEDKDESIEIKEGITQSTDHDHYYTEGDTHDNLKDVYCIECGAGMQIDKSINVEKGRVKWTQ